MYDVILRIQEPLVTYDLTAVLTAMATCSSTFIAIIGGLIANKAISITSEKESINRQLQQIDAELNVNEEEMNRLNEWIEEYDAKEFVHENIEALIEEQPLSEVYDTDNRNSMSYDDLLPFWEKALFVVKRFKEVSDEEKNDDGVPKILIKEFDDFQYEICKGYHRSIKRGDVNFFEQSSFNTVIISRGKYYDETTDRIEELQKICNTLNIKKQLLSERNDAISLDVDVKNGIKIFAVVSIVNIILPVLFMLFNPTSNKIWYYTEVFISIAAFIAGTFIMIQYIFSLFPKKDKKGTINDE